MPQPKSEVRFFISMLPDWALSDAENWVGKRSLGLQPHKLLNPLSVCWVFGQQDWGGSWRAVAPD
ncbi:MAG: hypothetical protein CVU11_14545 [Bacteroidetes bacterium HGW-Bacteroidetes-6]|nr:MAG: hypothetical protein CVU11_14545 [Bacteroidetes bacterium HGW-Bacteroidetes-6]